jgi:hypothetical protein
MASSKARRRTGSQTPIEGPPDVYSVTELSAGVYQVKHFPDSETKKACCNLKVEITDGDRTAAFDFEVVKGKMAAIHRAYLAIERKHAEAEQRGAA